MASDKGSSGADPGPGPGGSTDNSAARAVLLSVARQRNEAARQTVEALRGEHPQESPDELTSRVVRQCVRDLAVGGAMTGGAAAAPGAGLAGTAAVLGLEGANVARLGEMVMAIGILHGHENASEDDRALWVAAALGASEGTAMGLTGLAARAGARGSARLLARVPVAASASGRRLGRMGSRLAGKGGPWGLAALLPYGIGASVGAAGNAALALSVGQAAQRWFSAHSNDSGVSGSWTSASHTTTSEDGYVEEIWDVEVISERILDED